MTVPLSTEQKRHLTARIRELGRQRGLDNDPAIETRAHLAQKAISFIETGSKGPTLSTLLALCEGLGLYSIDQLLGFSAARYFARRDDVEGALGDMTGVLYQQVAEPPLQDPC